jgi:beta-glucosidase
MRAFPIPPTALSALYLLISPTLAQYITNHSYFYGQSPYVAPAPLPHGTTDSWAASYAKVVKLVTQLIQDEKASLIVGQANLSGCVGYIAPIERVGFHGLCLHDGKNGES